MDEATPKLRRSSFLKEALVAVFLAAAYFLAGKFGLRFASLNPSASAVWAPTGIALAAFLTLGHRVWPGIFLGAFLVNITTAGNVMTSLAIASGNTSEGLLGCYLVTRFAGGSKAFDRAGNVFKFAFLAGMVSTAVSATIGVTALALAGFADWNNYGAIWLTWWLGDLVGALVVTPLILLLIRRPSVWWTRREVLEGAALLLYLFLVSQTVFGNFFHSGSQNYPLEFLCVPFLIWAAFRFGPFEAATAVFVLAAVAIGGTLSGSGPFVRATQNESLILLQAFTAVMSVMTLSLAAEVAEHRRAEARVRYLAVTDSLTGLANYRRLVEVLDGEIRRSARTGRPFSVLLLDLDGLKKINDTHGHVVGSRALCRVAEALRIHSRAVDTAARYGGDEFALVLPETGAEAARRVAVRICAQLAGDNEEPRLSVSCGVAECPRDGETLPDLLRTADADLYDIKLQHHS